MKTIVRNEGKFHQRKRKMILLMKLLHIEISFVVRFLNGGYLHISTVLTCFFTRNLQSWTKYIETTTKIQVELMNSQLRLRIGIF